MAISLEATDMVDAPICTCATKPDKRSHIAWSSRSRSAHSSRPASLTAWVRSPSATAWAKPKAVCSGWVMERVVRQATPKPRARAPSTRTQVQAAAAWIEDAVWAPDSCAKRVWRSTKA